MQTHDAIIQSYRSCFDNSPLAFSIFEVLSSEEGLQPQNFKIRYANRACADLFGVEPKAMEHSSLEDLGLSPSTEVLSAWGQVALQGSLFKPAQPISVDGRLLKICCNQAAYGLCACVFQDVTTEAKALEGLQESSEKLAMAINQAQLQYWEYDMHTDRAYISDFSQSLYALPAVMEDFPESFLKTGAVHPVSIEAYRQMHLDIKNGAKDIVKDFKTKSEDEEFYAWTRIHYTTLCDKAGKPIKAIATATKLDDYKRLEEKLVYALEQTGIDVWIYDFATRRVLQRGNLQNPIFAEIDSDKAIPQCYIEKGFVHPEDVEKLRDLYVRLHQGVKRITATIRWKNPKDRDYWWNKISYTTIFTKDGKPHHAIGTSENITEKIRLEQRYNEEQKFHEMTQSSKLLTKVRANITQNLIESCEIHGRASAVEKGITCTAAVEILVQGAVVQEDKEKIRRVLNGDYIMKSFLQGNHEFSFDYRRRLQDGNIIWVSFAIKTFENPITKDIISFIYTYDIEEDKLREEILNTIATEEYDFIGFIDLGTNEYRIFAGDKKIPAAVPLHGFNYSEMILRLNAKTVVKEELETANRNMALEAIEESLHQKKWHNIVYSVYGDNGAVRKKRLHYAYLDRVRRHVLVTGTDITELINQQVEQQETLKTALISAQRANTAKSDFLSRMSHEIRTPMNAIIGMSAIAAQAIEDREQVADCLGKIGISSRYLLALINDILDMSRIESGKLGLKIAEIPFEEFLNEVNTICNEQAELKGVEYDCVLSSFMEEAYMGDAMKLQQVLVNIASNAIKFTPAGGKVQLLISQEKIKDGKAYLKFSINDTGIGIKEEFLPKLFDPFEQQSAGITSEYGGTGLGLAICKNLVSMMGGTITVNSIIGVGSEFIVSLALELCPKSLEKVAVAHPNIQLNRLKALVVDDDIIICEHTRDILLQMGITASWVDGGAKAVAEIRAKWEAGRYYDIVLLDWKMPDMDGIETARKIRQIVGPEVTIIIMTAFDWASIEHEAKAAGVNMLITKPLFKKSLQSAFEKIYSDKWEAAQPPKKTNYDFTGKRILLVEDHLLNVEVAKRLLEAKHATVEVAENGLVALEAFAAAPVGHFDLIFMDIRMPVMDGLTATKSIRQMKKETAKTIPIVAMSANAFDEDIEKSKAAGMNAHLAKPIEPALLYATLENFLKD